MLTLSQRPGMRSSTGNTKIISSETLGIEFLYPLVGVCHSFRGNYFGVSNATSHPGTLMCAARAQKHEEQRRLCSPESPVSHRYQVARWCARFTTHGLGWEGACRVWSLRCFVALYARILILHTENVRHRGGQQQRKQIVACAGACEFVARLWGDSRENQQGGMYSRASNVTGQSR